MAVDIDAKVAVVILFLGIALYNFIELNTLILSIFKKKKSLYFWSFTIATWGIAFNSVGYLLKHLELTTNANLYATLILIGWCSMITGQSVVLYSRLHLIMHNVKRLRAVLIMIITNAIWLHIPVIVLVYGSNSSNPKPFEKPYSIYEKIQLSVFILQEIIISGIYVWETTQLLKLERTIGNNGTFRVMTHLITVNIVVILLDFSILGLEFADLYEIQTSWKPLVYSIKLKLEFSILNRLVELTRKARSGNGYSNSRTAPRPEGMALGTLQRTGHSQFVPQNGDQPTHYEVHVGGGKGSNYASQPQDSTVVKTTEVQVQSHSRRRNSEASLAESGREILGTSAPHDEREVERGSASSVSSETQYAKYGDHRWP